MFFKSIIQYMKVRFWNICSRAAGSKVRLQWMVEHSSMEIIEESNQSCWANMPPELLTDIFMRIEESESDWPSRTNVVSCAGVCRSWRKNMKEILKCPQLSGKLTFPISLKQPGLVGSPTRCVIDIDIDKQIYFLFLRQPKAPVYHKTKFLLAAKRVRFATCIEYIICIHYDHVLGILRSNFLGTNFTVYDAHPPKPATTCHLPEVPDGNYPFFLLCQSKSFFSYYPVSSISYALGNRGPRQMRYEMNTITASSFLLPSLLKLKDVKLVLKNDRSSWQSKLWRWCLNFIGRVTFGSVRNFELVACLNNESEVKEQENIVLKFERVARGRFNMDYQYPLSAFQAFAICLSTFDTKVACE